MEYEPDLEEMLDEFTSQEQETFDSDEMLLDEDDTMPSSTPILDDHEIPELDAENTSPAQGTECDPGPRDRFWVIARIEEMLEKIIDGFHDPTHPISISLKSRANITRRQRDRIADSTSVPPPRTLTITFPGSTAQEAWRFTSLLRILELVHRCLVEDIVMTKRDIYYRHPDLFVKQSVVDRYIDDLACTFGVSRSLLNVAATAKGLIAGNFVLRREDGSVVYGLSEEEGILVPNLRAQDVFDLSSVKWVLVIEKEATFRSLISSAQWPSLGAQGLVLTGKGYPDLASRKFLRYVADHAGHIPMVAFVDLDPDGIAIMSTYKHGSYRLAHENGTQQTTPGLHLPELQWLGMQSHHLYRTPVGEGDTQTAALANAHGLMRLTTRDRRKAHGMLEWDVCGEDGPEPGWRAELQRMLMFNIKAEMQILDELPGGMVVWLSSELDRMHKLRLSSDWDDEEMLF